jgi:hypothetical protein
METSKQELSVYIFQNAMANYEYFLILNIFNL